MTDAAPDDGGLQVKVAEVAVLLETASDWTADGPTAETWDGLSIKIVDVNVKTTKSRMKFLIKLGLIERFEWRFDSVREAGFLSLRNTGTMCKL